MSPSPFCVEYQPGKSGLSREQLLFATSLMAGLISRQLLNRGLTFVMYSAERRLFSEPSQPNLGQRFTNRGVLPDASLHSRMEASWSLVDFTAARSRRNETTNHAPAGCRHYCGRASAEECRWVGLARASRRRTDLGIASSAPLLNASKDPFTTLKSESRKWKAEDLGSLDSRWTRNSHSKPAMHVRDGRDSLTKILLTPPKDKRLHGGVGKGGREIHDKTALRTAKIQIRPSIQLPATFTDGLSVGLDRQASVISEELEWPLKPTYPTNPPITKHIAFRLLQNNHMVPSDVHILILSVAGLLLGDSRATPGGATT
ncbi:hypothetical protein B0T21DRAFT_351839 [Apiosordaria backusii]|uniref:Uncharacterized protein n=1 Tax=Apiosordaria backusii TaxID=314023 RepID=A0AA40ANP1_9PEZI|nr:hypothetical protein B0T21DRAFT_351839 [Apiosordaria backusii]